MKRTQTFLFAVLISTLLSSCGAASEPTATPYPESMKGYEHYSWREGNEWNFSLLIGTNREKTLGEIKDAKIVLRGVNALTSALEQMPAGQYITWSSRDTLAFPPDEVIEQVEKVCSDRGLILNRAT